MFVWKIDKMDLNFYNLVGVDITQLIIKKFN